MRFISVSGMPGWMLGLVVLALVLLGVIQTLERVETSHDLGPEAAGSSAGSGPGIRVSRNKAQGESEPGSRFEDKAGFASLQIQGSVVDLSGDPLLARASCGSVSTWSNAEGIVELQVTPPSPVLRLRSEGFLPRSLKVPDDAWSSGFWDFGSVSLTGARDAVVKVQDLLGQPLRHVVVTWKRALRGSEFGHDVSDLSDFISAGKTSAHGLITIKGVGATSAIWLCVGEPRSFPQVVRLGASELAKGATIVVPDSIPVKVVWGQGRLSPGRSLEVLFRQSPRLSWRKVFTPAAQNDTIPFAAGCYSVSFRLPGSASDWQEIEVRKGCVLSPSCESSLNLALHVSTRNGEAVSRFQAFGLPVWNVSDTVPTSTLVSGISGGLAARGRNGHAELDIGLNRESLPNHIDVIVEARGLLRHVERITWPSGAKLLSHSISLEAAPIVRAKCRGIPRGSVVRLRQLAFADGRTARPQKPVSDQVVYEGQANLELTPCSPGRFLITLQVDGKEIPLADFHVPGEGTVEVDLNYIPSELEVVVPPLSPKQRHNVGLFRLEAPRGFMRHEFVLDPVARGADRGETIVFRHLRPGRYLVCDVRDFPLLKRPYEEQWIAKVDSSRSKFFWPAEDELKARVSVRAPEALRTGTVLWALVPADGKLYRDSVAWQPLERDEESLLLASWSSTSLRLLFGWRPSQDNGGANRSPLLLRADVAENLSFLDGQSLELPGVSTLEIMGTGVARRSLAAWHPLAERVFVDSRRPLVAGRAAFVPQGENLVAWKLSGEETLHQTKVLCKPGEKVRLDLAGERH